MSTNWLEKYQQDIETRAHELEQLISDFEAPKGMTPSQAQEKLNLTGMDFSAFCGTLFRETNMRNGSVVPRLVVKNLDTLAKAFVANVTSGSAEDMRKSLTEILAATKELTKYAASINTQEPPPAAPPASSSPKPQSPAKDFIPPPPPASTSPSVDSGKVEIPPPPPASIPPELPPSVDPTKEEIPPPKVSPNEVPSPQSTTITMRKKSPMLLKLPPPSIPPPPPQDNDDADDEINHTVVIPRKLRSSSTSTHARKTPLIGTIPPPSPVSNIPPPPPPSSSTHSDSEPSIITPNTDSQSTLPHPALSIDTPFHPQHTTTTTIRKQQQLQHSQSQLQLPTISTQFSEPSIDSVPSPSAGVSTGLTVAAPPASRIPANRRSHEFPSGTMSASPTTSHLPAPGADMSSPSPPAPETAAPALPAAITIGGSSGESSPRPGSRKPKTGIRRLSTIFSSKSHSNTPLSLSELEASGSSGGEIAHGTGAGSDYWNPKSPRTPVAGASSPRYGSDLAEDAANTDDSVSKSSSNDYPESEGMSGAYSPRSGSTSQSSAASVAAAAIMSCDRDGEIERLTKIVEAQKHEIRTLKEKCRPNGSGDAEVQQTKIIHHYHTGCSKEAAAAAETRNLAAEKDALKTFVHVLMISFGIDQSPANDNTAAQLVDEYMAEYGRRTHALATTLAPRCYKEELESGANGGPEAPQEDVIDVVTVGEESRKMTFDDNFRGAVENRGRFGNIYRWSGMLSESKIARSTFGAYNSILTNRNESDDSVSNALTHLNAVVVAAGRIDALTTQVMTSMMLELGSANAVTPEGNGSVEAAGDSTNSGEITDKFIQDSLDSIRGEIIALLTLIRNNVSDTKSIESTVTVCNKIADDLAKVDILGTVNNDLVGTAKTSRHYREVVALELTASISDCTQRISLMLSQILTLVPGLPFTALDNKAAAPLWEFYTCCYHFAVLLGELASKFQTAKAINALRVEEHQHHAAQSDTVALWDEVLNKVDVPKGEFNKDGVPKYVSLNALIASITDPAAIATQALKTAMVTSLSFAEPQVVLEKLIERFNTPQDVDASLAVGIRNRVTIVLKQFIEAQYDDFDEDTIKVLEAFMDGPLAVHNPALCQMFKRDLSRRRAIMHQRQMLTQIPHCEIPLYPGSRTPMEHFLEGDELVIAQQLTMISLKIFTAIQPKELLDQAWIKPKLQYRAPNVVLFQERTALLSQFVGILIMSKATAEERAEVMNKVLRIMGHLLKLNNFNDLMALYTGFVIASVNRLNAAKALIDPKCQKMLKYCDKALAPLKSFKQYRSLLEESSGSIIPILSVTLNDLTFVDEGNPDCVNGLINFEKRALMFDVIGNLQKYQKSEYNFPIVEPLHSILCALPTCTEAVLYDYSLIREPRKATSVSASVSSHKNRRFSKI